MSDTATEEAVPKIWSGLWSSMYHFGPPEDDAGKIKYLRDRFLSAQDAYLTEAKRQDVVIEETEAIVILGNTAHSGNKALCAAAENLQKRLNEAWKETNVAEAALRDLKHQVLSVEESHRDLLDSCREPETDY